MKMNSGHNDIDAEAHIRRLIREMEELHDEKNKWITRNNGASYSLLHSSLYSKSKIATDAITPHQGYSERS